MLQRCIDDAPLDPSPTPGGETGKGGTCGKPCRARGMMRRKTLAMGYDDGVDGDKPLDEQEGLCMASCGPMSEPSASSDCGGIDDECGLCCVTNQF